MIEFNYDKLREVIGFPTFIEENVLKIEQGVCFKQLVFEYEGLFYEIEGAILPLDKHDDYEAYFEVECNGKVICKQVELVEVQTHAWIAKNGIKKEVEQLRIELSNELRKLPISDIEKIKVSLGKKYKGKTVKEIYCTDSDFIVWCKNNPPVYKLINKFVRDKEKGRLAMIVYYDMVDFLKNQGS